jgi:hypothetical protein
MERTASKAKMTEGLKLNHSAHKRTGENPTVPHSNAKINKGAVAHTFYENSMSIDCDCVYHGGGEAVTREE